MRVSEKPWSPSTSDYDPAGAWCDACLINTNDGRRATWLKSQCKLPVFEPDGALNRNAVHAAAAVLAGARGGVDASPRGKQAAARRLIGLYRVLDEEPPDSIDRIAGRRT